MPVLASLAAAEVLASNIGQPAGQTPNAIFADSMDRQAQRFTTGSNSAEYSLESMGVEYGRQVDVLNTGKETEK